MSVIKEAGRGEVFGIEVEVDGREVRGNFGIGCGSGMRVAQLQGQRRDCPVVCPVGAVGVGGVGVGFSFGCQQSQFTHSKTV